MGRAPPADKACGWGAHRLNLSPPSRRVPRPRILARFKVGAVAIDVYDERALSMLLEWVEKVGAKVEAAGEGPAEGRGEPEPVQRGEPAHPALPDFARDNPWLAVIARRG